MADDNLAMLRALYIRLLTGDGKRFVPALHYCLGQ